MYVILVMYMYVVSVIFCVTSTCTVISSASYNQMLNSMSFNVQAVLPHTCIVVTECVALALSFQFIVTSMLSHIAIPLRRSNLRVSADQQTCLIKYRTVKHVAIALPL